MIVGLALALSLSSGGLWAVRRKGIKGGGKGPMMMLVACLGVALLTGAVAWANGAPRFPPQKQQPAFPAPAAPQVPGPMPTMGKFDGVKVDIVQQGDTVRLILTKKQKEELKGAK